MKKILDQEKEADVKGIMSFDTNNEKIINISKKYFNAVGERTHFIFEYKL